MGADVAPSAPDVAPAPTPARISHVARVLALAHHWHGLILSGAVRDQSELARLVGVTRGRISQVMRLFDLAPEIQVRVLDRRLDPPGGERSLRAEADLPLWAEQRRVGASGNRDVPSP